MDSLTHIAIGACIGDLFLGKQIGKRAMFYGAIAASLPDIDFIASFWLNATDNLLAHRGFTHSILFAILATVLLALLFRKPHATLNIPFKTWFVFLGTEILVHIFLDAFNAYGIGWFEPFNHTRISFNIIFVADPFFSIWPAAAAIILVFLNRYNLRRKGIAILGLLLCSLYLFYCLTNKFKINDNVRYSLNHQEIHFKHYFSTPTAFNNWLWYIVVETDSGFDIGYRSVFDKQAEVVFQYYPRNDSLLSPLLNKTDLQKLIRFSKGYYTAEMSEQGILFNDLRFGQIMGWQNSNAHFVFHYYLDNPEANRLVVQRGRFSNWDRENIRSFIRRIRGR
jgi:inner membrane protein